MHHAMGEHEKETQKINITTFPGLEGLIDPISQCITVANIEREYLGLQVPENYSVYAHLFSLKNQLGAVEPVGWEYVLHVYIANSLRHRVVPEQIEKLDRLKCYLLHVKDLFPSYSEEIIFTPLRVEGILANDFLPQSSLRKEAREYVLHHAAGTRDDLANVIPHLVEQFPKCGMTVIRHELDHIDFMESTIFQDYRRKLGNVADMKTKYEEGTGSIYEYEEANTEVIEAYCFLYTFMESRALFFTHTKVGFNDTDYDAVAKQVVRTLSSWYVENFFPQNILEYLLAPLELNGTINKDTATYCRHVTNIHNFDARKYRYDLKLVDESLANDIVLRSLERWKTKCSDLATGLVPVIRRIFQEDPSRFTRAQEKTTYKEFLAACNGN